MNTLIVLMLPSFVARTSPLNCGVGLGQGGGGGRGPARLVAHLVQRLQLVHLLQVGVPLPRLLLSLLADQIIIDGK